MLSPTFVESWRNKERPKMIGYKILDGIINILKRKEKTHLPLFTQNISTNV